MCFFMQIYHQLVFLLLVMLRSSEMELSTGAPSSHPLVKPRCTVPRRCVHPDRAPAGGLSGNTPFGGFHTHGGTQFYGWFIGKIPLRWMMTRGSPISGNLHLAVKEFHSAKKKDGKTTEQKSFSER